MDYWKECIEEAFEDAGITATQDQIDTVISWAEGAHENYGQATGNDVTSANLHAANERDRREAMDAIEKDHERQMESERKRLINMREGYQIERDRRIDAEDKLARCEYGQ